MNIVLLQSKVTEEEIQQLCEEFPQFLFLAFSETAYKNMTPADWARVEILYGSRLTAEELKLAHQLHWIHSPSTFLNALCLKEIEARGNLLLTASEEENVRQIGEFVLAAILGFAKNLFLWKESNLLPDMVWDSKGRDTMWSLQGKKMVQVGLGVAGSEIARQAKLAGLAVWGVRGKATFHPHCEKVFSFQDLNKALEEADIVSVALPRGKQKEQLFRREQFEAMKDDSVLIVIGSKTVIDERALCQTAKDGKFRGILIDVFYQVPIPSSSKLWDLPNIIITPEVSPRPKSTAHESFRLFRYNLRQYMHDNYSDMRHLVEFS